MNEILEKPKVREINSELERYEVIINYFEKNNDRIFTKDNQEYLTRVYAELLNQNKSHPSLGFGDLSDKIYNLVGGPNYLLGHWKELERLEMLN